MAQHTERFKAFVKLGDLFREFTERTSSASNPISFEEKDLNLLYEKTRQASEYNAWFTLENIYHAISAWGEALRKEHLEHWMAAYSPERNKQKTVAIIMAGNIPLVGFHDFLSVLITGNRALVKLSSNDRVLLPVIGNLLSGILPELGDAMTFTDSPIREYDAVIATGSNNTARYFDYYFGNKPNIIRRNRNSVGILKGDETPTELEALGSDIFTYFGLGCRNVSKLYVPENYEFKMLFDGISSFSEVVNHRKYGNNYDYNKAVYLMSGFPFLDNGFLLLKEDRSYSSPIGTLFYEHYNSPEDLEVRIAHESEQLQCVVGRSDSERIIPFGQTQQPALWDYADNRDTVAFLLET